MLDGSERQQAQSVEFWPPVRLHITEKHYAGSWRSENECPITRTQRTKFYLAQEDRLVDTSVSGGESVTYKAISETVFWQKTFTQSTEVTGTSRLHLSLSISSGSDADLFVTLQKFNRDGKVIHFHIIRSLTMDMSPGAGQRCQDKEEPISCMEAKLYTPF